MAEALIVGGIIGGLTATTSALQARQQNRDQAAAIKATYAARNRAIGVQQQQTVDQGALQKQKAFNRAQLIRSRIRVSAGESGIGYGGTYEAMMNQADYDQSQV